MPFPPMTSGANSPDPAQDRQASNRKGRPLEIRAALFRRFSRLEFLKQSGTILGKARSLLVLCNWGWGYGVGVGESVRKQGNRVHSRRGDHRKPKGKGRDASTGFVVEALSEIHARCRQAAAIRFSASSLN